MSGAQKFPIFSATISIFRCGNDGKKVLSRIVRRDKKFIGLLGFIVTYLEEYGGYRDAVTHEFAEDKYWCWNIESQ